MQKLIGNSKLEIRNSFEKGYIALSSIIIIMAVVLSITTTVTLLAIGEGQTALALTKGEDELSFSDGCLEDGLNRARQSANFTNTTITRPEGTCTITVSKAGTTWTITATTTDTDYVRTVRAIATVDGYSVTLTSWKEI